mmetsp:Transcript_7102/g.11305  ORF Transcript_7102/g.11305 Transcript_7102/m.11305 type:complete len:570 (+) Transcript_7102:312-2021(+)
MEYGGHDMRPRSISERLQRSVGRLHIYLQGNIPLAWLLFVLIFCSVMSQCMIMMLAPTKLRDPETDHWLRFHDRGKVWRAPVIVYQDAKYKGWQMPIYENVSNLRALHFRDISSMRVSKGVTVVLYSNNSWQGTEISIDNDVTYVGHKWNDRANSIALEFEPVTPHAVEFYRAGASMGLEAKQCPRDVVCSPDATLDMVPGSVYMAISNLMRENLHGLVGCRIYKFFRPDGRMIFGMLPPKVYYVCEGDNFILPAEVAGFAVKVPVPSLFRRVRVTTLSTLPRVHQVVALMTVSECAAYMDIARSRLVRAGTSKENPQYSAWSASMCGKHCQDAREDDKLSVSVVARAAEVLGLSPDLAEGVIVRRYEQGTGEEKMHTEWNVMTRHRLSTPGASSINRFVTVIIFLNEPEEGGEIFFPQSASLSSSSSPSSSSSDPLKAQDASTAIGGGGVGAEKKWGGMKGIDVKPFSGNAVLMYNLVATGHMLGQVDESARIAASPVVRGEKWVAEVRFLNRLDTVDEWNKAAREKASEIAAGSHGLNWKAAKMKHGPKPSQLPDIAMQLQMGRLPT